MKIKNLPLIVRLAWREMPSLASGGRGFRIFLLCLILGIATIAGVGSLSAAFVGGLAAEGQAILGGDVSLRLAHRRASAAERAWLKHGAKNVRSLSEVATLRSMVRVRLDSKEDNNTALVELKAVDAIYPLYGAVLLSHPSSHLQEAKDKQSLNDIITRPPTEGGANTDKATPLYYGVAEADLFDRLDLDIGAQVRIGAIDVELVARLVQEPDRTSGGFPLAPRLLISHAALKASDLVREGSLVHFHYRVKLAPENNDSNNSTTSNEILQNFISDAQSTFPYAGWQIRDRNDASPTLRRFIERMALFFTAIGLTALVVGGVGVSNAIGAYLTTRRETMAILKSLGAPATTIIGIYGVQIALFTMLGVVIGLALGAALPLLAQVMIGDVLPVQIIAALYPAPLLSAAGFGILTAIAFALYPLGLIEKTPVAQLFGGAVRLVGVRPAPYFIFGIALCFIGLVAMVFLLANSIAIALWFCVGLAFAYFALRIAAAQVIKLAFWCRQHVAHNMILRFALAHITRPHAPVLAVTLSIGLSVALLASIALVEGNLSRQIDGNLPTRLPSFFMLDIQPDQIDDVRVLVEATTINTTPAITPAITPNTIETLPMLRGQVLSINGVAVADLEVPPQAAWIFRGDRNLTYAETPPPGGEIVAGQWWAADYSGAPLLSFDADIAAHLGVVVGDMIGVNILGRPLQARVANLRRVDWASGGINFAMIFSPEPLRFAPHVYLASVHIDETQEVGFIRTISRDYPNITLIRVKDALQRAADILRQLQLAVQIMSAITLATGLLVLAGAMAGSHYARLYDSVILKILGASRRHILAIYALEYMLVGAAAAFMAAALATLASWGLVAGLMDADWVFLPLPLILTLTAGVLVAASLGIIATLYTLNAPVASALRAQ